MSFRDWLRGVFAGKTPELDPLDLSLTDLKKGYLVDYDLKTWQVISHNRYDFDGDQAHEWELFSGDERCYLGAEKDDEYVWSVSRKIAFSALGPEVKDHLLQHDDPPQAIVYDGTRYSLEESGAGYFFPDSRKRDDKSSQEEITFPTASRVAGDELIYWDYTDETGEKLLTIEQWGETEFEASVGKTVQAYEFRNILPQHEE